MSSPGPQHHRLTGRPIERPLSPFMLGQYYRFQLTSVLSFLHRLTGIGLSLGGVLLVWWLMLLAFHPWGFAEFTRHVVAWYGQALLFGWSWALLYHLCNGIRHLVWDLGHGYSIPVAYRSGYAVVAVSVLLTATAWGIAYGL